MADTEHDQATAIPEPPGLLIAVLASICIATLGINTLPLLLGSVIDGLEIGERQGGLVGTVELGAVALVSLLLAPLLGRWRRNRIAILGGFIAVLGYVVSAASEAYTLVLLGRLICGAGAGAVMAAGNAALAASDNPDGLMARVMLVVGVGAAILLGTLPLALGPWGYPGGYLVLACITLLCLPLMRNLPPPPRRGIAATTEKIRHPLLGGLLILAIFLDAISQEGLWAFSERIGEISGLTIEEVGIVLAFTTLAGVAGSILAYVLSNRIGRGPPLAIGLGIGAVARWTLASASEPATYSIAQLLLGLSFFLTYPFLIGAIAELDRTGRLSALAAGIVTIGSAAGPVTAGELVAWGGYPALGVLGVGMALATALLALPTVRILAQSDDVPEES